MKRIFGESWIPDTLTEIVGSILTGVAIYNFAVPARFPMTGFSGLALILYRLFGTPIGVMTIVLNIPVALICYRLLGRQFFFRSLRCMVLSSRLLASICTGVLGGLGYAMIYMRSSSTGGSDFIVMAVKAVRPHVQLGKIIFITDAVIIGLGGLIFRDFDGVIYGLIIDYIYAIVTDKIMYGMNAGKLALVVTDHGKAAADKIDELCGRGATIIEARGAFRGNPRQMVMCACSTKEMLTVERAVKLVDPNAFTVILESNEVVGEGFKTFRVAEKQE